MAMKTIIYKLIGLLLMLLMCANNVSAIDLDITLEHAGDLVNKVDIDNLNDIVKLRISGDINGSDIIVINKMTNLRELNVEDANIKGGTVYDGYGNETVENTIKDYFNGYRLMKLVLPNSVTTIYNCSINPRGHLVLGRNLNKVSFMYNTSVDTLTYRCKTIQASIVKGGGRYAFAPNVIVIDNGVEEIISGSFSAHDKTTPSPIKRVIIKSSTLDRIGGSAFSQCDNLSYIDLGENIKVIGSYCFNNCTSLTSLTLPNTLEEIGNSAFRSSGITEIIIPKSVKTLGTYAFSESSISKVTMNNDLTELPDGVFAKCHQLKKVDFLPQSLTSIGDSAFFYCHYLKEIHLPNKIKTIGTRAFDIIYHVDYLNIPKSLTTIGDKAFDITSGNIYFDDFNTWFTMNTSSQLCDPPGSYADIVYVYDNGNLLKEITIPPEITKIRKNMFSGFSSLEAIHLHNGITEIGIAAFQGCAMIKSFKLPPKINKIPYYAFNKCRELETLFIPSKVLLIEGDALSSNDSLKHIIVRNPNPPQLDYFYGVRKSSVTLYVPYGSKSSYFVAPGWGDFGQVKEISDDGDINSDGNIDILDVTTLINDVLNGSASNLLIDDINGDGEIDVQDVTALINLILN